MGNPCSSGSGAPNPGSGAVAFLSNLAVSAFLSRIGFGWLATVAGALPQFSFDVDEFCTNGQPALPTFDALDVLALSSPATNVAYPAAAQKVSDLVLHYLWYELCHCEDVATPAPPAPQTPPDVVGFDNPGDEPCMQTPECEVTYEYAFIFGSDPAGSLWWADNSSSVGCGDFSHTVTPRQVRYVIHRERGPSGEHEDPFHFRVSFQNVFSTTPSNYVDVYAPGDDYDNTFIVPAGTTRTFVTFVPGEVETQPDHENPLDTMHVTGYAYCDVLPGGPTTVCCPPDAGILAAINSLASQLQFVRDKVDLIQKQGVPFAYVYGSDSGNRTGKGKYNFAEKVVGIQAFLEVVPSDAGRLDGDTDELFTDSWINFVSAGVAGPSIRLTNENQLIFPPFPGVYDQLSYSLRPGISAIFFELLREAPE